MDVIDQEIHPLWAMYQGDAVEVASGLPDESVHYQIFSPPFPSLYTYSASERDLGNSPGHDAFWKHYRYLIEQQVRVLKPGRLISVHCMLIPTSKQHDGYIGLRDFRGDIIRAHEDAGLIFHSEVSIWKDPVQAAVRTKALGLLHKQLKKDSAMSRNGINDFLVTFRKPGENTEPISHTDQSFPVSEWQNLASPCWTDIHPSDTLQYRSARAEEDEKHICPMQLEVIRRGLRLWTNPGDVVLSPFAGIGSEGYVALEQGRRFIGAELKESYYQQAIRNLSSVAGDAQDPYEILFADLIA
jgi:DNA modification methylase